MQDTYAKNAAIGAGIWQFSVVIIILRPRQNGRHFADDI